MIKMKCCEMYMSDINGMSHMYCSNCGRHYYKKKYYTAEQWFFFVNSTIYDKQLNKL